MNFFYGISNPFKTINFTMKLSFSHLSHTHLFISLENAFVNNELVIRINSHAISYINFGWNFVIAYLRERKKKQNQQKQWRNGLFYFRSSQSAHISSFSLYVIAIIFLLFSSSDWCVCVHKSIFCTKFFFRSLFLLFF